MLYERISNERQRICNQLHSLEQSMTTLPEGKLVCSHNGNYCKWYQSDGTHKTYIPKSNRTLAEQLAVKKYLSCLHDDLSLEKTALDFYLKHHHNDHEQADRLLEDANGYSELLAPYFKSDQPKNQDWMQAPFEQNTKNPEHLVHKTLSGHFVRSKSEAMIDHHLFTNRIPFRYECALHLENTVLYPDFTIRHPETGEIFYWEHFGLMDDPSYSRAAASKLQIYIVSGIIPSIQLITTYETQKHPLSTEVIHKIVEHYFL